MAYTTGRNLRLSLEPPLKSGGEGSIHAVVGLPDRVAKLYHPHKLQDGELEEKLRVMIAYPPDDPMKPSGHRSIAWPESLIRADGRFAGYLMPRIRRPQEIVEFYNPAIRRGKHPSITWKQLHAIARNLSVALAAVHARRHVVGDLNQGNIFVNEATLVTLIDTDSFQIRDPRDGRLFRCKVGKGEFLPPELHGQPLSEVDRQPHHDVFGLGVLIFMLLMEGHHPFMGVEIRNQVSLTGPAYEHHIRKGNFPYGASDLIRPPPTAPNYEALHPRLRELFRRCFVAGHANPDARPSAREWHQALQAAEAALVRCRAVAAHWYSPHLVGCPWCERAAP